MATKEVLTPEEASAYLGLSKVTLARMRVRGDGPAFSQYREGGPVRYMRADLDEWLERGKRHSTSETLRDAAA